jgi:hypothetical protein
MYRYSRYVTSNTLEFKKGYRLGLEKGRKLERKVCLIMMTLSSLVWLAIAVFSRSS